LDEDTVPRWSRLGIGLLVLALLVATFAFARKAAHEQHRRAVAEEARQRTEEQRTADNKAALEAQARGLIDLDTLLGQLQAAGIPPAISREQVQADTTPVTATTTTTTTPRRRGSTPTTSPPTTSPPSQPPPSSPPPSSPPPTQPPPPPPPQRPCITVPPVGPIPPVSVCAG
jgi:heme exporter protein D